ncbi:hypothetical protein ACWDTT_36150 [Streptosporangium sandarakinum]
MRSLRALGMSLDEIKEVLASSPEDPAVRHRNGCRTYSPRTFATISLAMCAGTSA